MPPFAAVAEMERASIKATAEICPSSGLEPSRLSKFLVVWRMLKQSFAGTSPAPKQGPQKQERTETPACIKVAIEPFLTSSVKTGWLPG